MNVSIRAVRQSGIRRLAITLFVFLSIALWSTHSPRASGAERHRNILLFSSQAANQNSIITLNQSIRGILSRGLPGRVQFYYECLDQSRSPEELYRQQLISFDGSQFPIEASISEVEAGGQRLHTVILRDITKRKKAEDALRQTQSELAHVDRVMITGELAATIAHEVNQPLTAMVENANAARRMLGHGGTNLEEAREAIDIVKDAHRASEVVGRIRALLRKGGRRPEELSINEVIDDVAAILRNELSNKRVWLRLELSNRLPSVEPIESRSSKS